MVLQRPSQRGASPVVGYTYATLMLAGLLLGTLCDNQQFQRVMRAGMMSCPVLAFCCVSAALLTFFAETKDVALVVPLLCVTVSVSLCVQKSTSLS